MTRPSSSAPVHSSPTPEPADESSASVAPRFLRLVHANHSGDGPGIAKVLGRSATPVQHCTHDGERFREMRLRLGWSQHECAKRHPGVITTARQVRRWERSGEMPLRTFRWLESEVQKLADEFGVILSQDGFVREVSSD